jgi:hypothetical protein
MAFTRTQRIAEKVKAMLQANGSGVGWYYEAEQADRHAERRRIAWVAASGRVEPARTAGGGNNDLASPAAPRLVDLVATMGERVVCSCYAEDRAIAEQLMANLMVALARICTDGVVFEQYSWPSQADDKAGRTVRVQRVDLAFRLLLPVPNVILPLGQDYLALAGDALTVCVDTAETCDYVDTLEVIETP